MLTKSKKRGNFDQLCQILKVFAIIEQGVRDVKRQTDRQLFLLLKNSHHFGVRQFEIGQNIYFLLKQNLPFFAS